MSVVDAVRLDEQTNIATAWIGARPGVDAAVISAAAGMAMPEDRRWTADDSTTLTSNGPGIWLVQRRDAHPGWVSDLEQRLVGLASVSDQTGAYRVFRLEGLGARTLLQRGVAIDLHDSTFPAGSVAATAIAHIDVVLRCLEAGKVYEMAVYRSYAESFCRWLEVAMTRTAS